MKTLLALLFSLPLFAKELPDQAFPVADPAELGVSSAILDEIDPSVQKLIADQKLAGASVLVLRKGQIVYQREFGHRDIAAGAMMSEDSIFRIYSMTKGITSAAALMLYEDGKLSLDEPIATYLPGFKEVTVWNEDGDPLSANRAPTVRDLLRHTAGFTYGWGLSGVDKLYQSVNPLDRDKTLAEMSEALEKIPLLYQPGDQWVYGVNTDVLARIIEVVSGQSFDDFLKARLFIPLGMTDTDFHVPEEKAERFTAVYSAASGELLPVEPIEDSPFLETPANLSGGGGLVSTITDYARFLQMIANGGTLAGKRYLRRDTVSQMSTNQLPKEIPAISMGKDIHHGTGFGLGFSVRIAKDKRWNPHAPVGEYGWGGMASTHYWISPKDELVVITMEQTLPYNGNLEAALKPIIYRAVAD